VVVSLRRRDRAAGPIVEVRLGLFHGARLRDGQMALRVAQKKRQPTDAATGGAQSFGTLSHGTFLGTFLVKAHSAFE
jgi:hypothetical protein